MVRAALLVSLMLALFAGPLSAAEAGRAPAQIRLTPQRVENFIASYEPVKAFNAQYDAEWRDENFSDQSLSGADKMRQVLEAHGALKTFNALVAQYGFEGIEDWWPVAYSTMIAYGFSEPGYDPAKARDDILKALADLDKKPGLSPAQKQQYRAQLTHSLASYEAMKPPPGNVAVVTPYRAKLKALLGE